MKQLMRTPKPVWDESPIAYLTRLAESNGYGNRGALLSLMGTSSDYVITSSWDFSRLQDILGGQCKLPEGFGYAKSGQAIREGGVILGHALHFRNVGLTRARLCTHCLSELGYVPAKWDLKAYLACPFHGVSMLKHCSACGWRILHARPGVHLCRCGSDLRLSRTTAATPHLLGLCEILDAIATRTSCSILHARSLGMPTVELLRMDLEVFLRVIVGIATVLIGLRGRMWPVKQTEVSTHFPEVGLVLSNWPRNFQILCRRWHQARLTNEKIHSGFQATFSWLFTRLHKNLKERRGQTTFMLEAALRYGMRHWDRKPIQLREAELKVLELPRPRYGTFADAAKVLGWPAHTVVRWLGSGRLPAFQRGTNRNRPLWLVDLDTITDVQVSRHPSVGQREGAARLGIPHAVYRELMQRDALPRSYQSEFRKCSAREDLDDFASQILRRSLGVPPGEKTIKLSEFFASNYSIQGKADVLVALANGDVPSFGSSARRIRDLSIPRSIADAHVGKPCMPPELVSINGAVKRFGLGYYEARAIFRLQGRVGRKRPSSFSIEVAQVEKFLQEHEVLRQVAERLGVFPGALAKAVQESIPEHLIRLPAGNGPQSRGGVTYGLFVKRSSLGKVRQVARRLNRRLG